MKNWIWWMYFKGLFSNFGRVEVAKEPTEVDRRVALYHAESRKRMADNETLAKQSLAEALANNYKENFKNTIMFLIGHRPNPVYINLLSYGYPELPLEKIIDLFYKISAESELVAQAYLNTPGAVDIPTPVYDSLLAGFNVRISFMGDIYPIMGSPTYLIQRYGVWVAVHERTTLL